MPESLTEAVASIRLKSLVVVKTARNTGINSDYASYADVMAVLRPELEAAGVAVGFLPSHVRKEGEAWVQELVLEISHGSEKERAAFQVLFPEGNRGVNLTQRQGMAHTYGKRYALVDYFHLITGDDDDAVRLGQTGNGASAPRAAEAAHWSEYCFVPLFAVGSAEQAGTWTVLADPSDDDGERTLGDNQPKTLAKLWTQHPKHPGLNAWRAELIQTRAEGKGVQDWIDCRNVFKQLNLPATMIELDGAGLNKLALALA